MPIQEFKVPSISCEGCGETITKAIQESDPKASVRVNIEGKQVNVASDMSEASIRQVIESVGHEIGTAS